jgi:hypothetical protein
MDNLLMIDPFDKNFDITITNSVRKFLE